jgi:mRNA interferase MazF
MKREEIYFIKSNYREEGSEQRADRPAVIVSNDKNNEHSDVVEIVYMTTKPKTDLPTHVFTRSALQPSTILCEQVNSISVKRIGTWIGELTVNELAAVDTALAISLGIDFGNVQSVQIREPEPEEIEKLAKEMQAQPIQIMQAENDVEKIKLETERDLYRKLYSELLENVTKGARA